MDDMTSFDATLEPGDAAAVIANAVLPWLREKQDVVVRPGACEVQRGAPGGWQKEVHAAPRISDAIVRAAIQDLAAGEMIPAGLTRTQKVWLEGQCARVVLSPHAGIFGGPGPEIYYRWLPSV